MKEELNVSNVKQWTYPFIFLLVSFPVLIAPSVDVFMGLLRSGFSGEHFFDRLDYGHQNESIAERTSFDDIPKILVFINAKPVQNAAHTLHDRMTTIMFSFGIRFGAFRDRRFAVKLVGHFMSGRVRTEQRLAELTKWMRRPAFLIQDGLHLKINVS